MKKLLTIMAVLLLLCPALPLMAKEGAGQVNFIEFQKLLDGKCGKCHTRSRIDQAMSQGEAFVPILERMTKHGADLNENERNVLGVFWRENVPGQQPPAALTAKDDPLAEYRSVLQARCTGCHNLERIEAAMKQSRSFETLAQMMLKRGAVLSEADRKVLGTFWGEPLR